MSDWSSFQGDKSRYDKWRVFLTESRSPQKIDEIESYYDFGSNWSAAKEREKQDKALKIDKSLKPVLQNLEKFMHKNMPKRSRNIARNPQLVVDEFVKFLMSPQDWDGTGVDFDIPSKTNVAEDDLSAWLSWRINFPESKREQLKALRAERDAPPVGSKRSEEEEEEAEEEDTSFFDRVRDMGAKAKDTMTKKRSFFGTKGKDKKAPPEEYPASGFASLYKTLDDINKRLKVVDRGALYGELEKLFKDQNFVVQESQIMIEAPGEIEGGALILGRNPQFNLRSYPALMKLSQAASKNTQLAKALKSAFVGAGFKGVNISPATEKGPAKPEAAAEPEAAEPPVKTMPSGAEPPVRPMPSGAEPPVRPMPSGAKSKAQKFEPSAATATKTRGRSKKGDYSVLPQSTTRASKIGAGAHGPNKDKAIKEDALVEHWQKLAGIIKG